MTSFCFFFLTSGMLNQGSVCGLSNKLVQTRAKSGRYSVIHITVENLCIWLDLSWSDQHQIAVFQTDWKLPCTLCLISLQQNFARNVIKREATLISTKTRQFCWVKEEPKTHWASQHAINCKQKEINICRDKLLAIFCFIFIYILCYEKKNEVYFLTDVMLDQLEHSFSL